MTAIMDALAAMAVTGFARMVTGVRGNWRDSAPDPSPRVYFGNHSSHGDFVLIWTVLPPALRRATRPVAGADYWNVSATRRYIGQRVFRAVLIDRDPKTRQEDPIAQMATALDEGASLILFPEGTRNTTDTRLLPFKSGLYHLAKARPAVDLVPVWIQNLNRVMPKGEFIPIPLLCTVTFGAPIRLNDGEDRATFLARATSALLGAAPTQEHDQ